MNTCPLCRATLAPRITESTYWQLILNYNQNLLGKCFLVLRRHLEYVPHLTLPEWTDLYEQLGRTTFMLDHAFSRPTSTMPFCKIRIGISTCTLFLVMINRVSLPVWSLRTRIIQAIMQYLPPFVGLRQRNKRCSLTICGSISCKRVRSHNREQRSITAISIVSETIVRPSRTPARPLTNHFRRRLRTWRFSCSFRTSHAWEARYWPCRARLSSTVRPLRPPYLLRAINVAIP